MTRGADRATSLDGPDRCPSEVLGVHGRPLSDDLDRDVGGAAIGASAGIPDRPGSRTRNSTVLRPEDAPAP